MVSSRAVRASFAAHHRLARVLHLYLAVADAERGEREPHERQLAIDLGRRWAPSVGLDAVEAAVDTAYEAARAGLAPQVERVTDELSRILSPAARRRLLVDLGRVARAHGSLSQQKARAIAQIRLALGSGNAL